MTANGVVAAASVFLRRACLALGILVLVAACGGGSGGGGADTGGGGSGGGSGNPGGGGPDTGPGVEPLACQAGLSATSGRALDVLEISGLSDDFLAELADPEQPLFAEAYRRGATAADDVLLALLPLHVEADETGAATVLLPLPFDPDRPFDATELGFIVVAGEERCELPDVTIAGLRPAADPDAALAVLDQAMMDLLSGYAADYGILGWNHLVAAAEAFEPNDNLPMGLVAVLLGVDAHLQAQAYLADGDPDGRALLAALLETLDLAGSLRDKADLLAFKARSGAAGASTGLQSLGAATLAGPSAAPIMAASMFAASSLCTQFPGDRVEISSPEDLDYYMRLQQIAEQSLNSPWRTIITGSLPAIPGSAGNVAALVAFVEALVTARDAYQLPNRFTLLEFQLDPGASIPEDYEQAGKVARWHDARANAASQQWVLDGAILDAFSELVSVGRWIKGGGPGVNPMVDLDAWINDYLKGTLANYGQLGVFEKLKQRAEGADCFVMQANSWAGIDVTHEDYTRAEVSGGSIELLKSGDQFTRIKLLDVGTSLLDLSIRNDNDRWGGWRALNGSEQFGGRKAKATEAIDVPPINVRFTPAITRVQELGEIVTLRVRVSDSELAAQVDPIVMLSAGASIVSGPDLEALVAPRTADYLLDVQTPTDGELYSVHVQAWRVSPLPPGEVRDGAGEIVYRETLTLSPRNACVEPDEVLTLTAELGGFAPATVLDWAVESPGTLGNFVNQGLVRTADFRSSQRGSFLVQVSAPSVILPGEEVTDSVRVAVGNCLPVHLWGSLTTFAEAGESEQRYESEALGIFEEAPFPPARHSQYWMGRSFELVESVQAIGVINEQSARAAALTRASWEADEDGTVTIRHVVGPAGNACIPPADEPGDVRCSEALSTMLGAAVFYVDIDAPRTVRVRVEGNCSLSGDLAGGLGVAGYAQRLPAGSTSPEQHVPPNGPYFEGHLPENFINPFIISIAPPFLPPSDDNVGNICSSAYGGRWSFDQEFELDGPIEPGTTDLVTFTIGVGSTTVLDYVALNLTDMIGLGIRPNPSGGIGFIPLPLGSGAPYGPVVGTYEGSGETEVTISVQ